MNICPDCKNSFLQPFVCTTCGAEKLYDTTLANTQSELAAVIEQRDEAVKNANRYAYAKEHFDDLQMWWDTEGSAMRPHDNEDFEEFSRRITEIAWENGRNGRELAAAIAQRDEAVSRYDYVKKHFDEIYQLPIWTNDDNPDYRIDSDKFDAAIDAAMKEV
jgi:hypothetical protein